MIRRREENSDEYWFANWWMGEFVTSEEFNRILYLGPTPKWFDVELKAHYIDWLEELSEEAFQEHLDRQTNLVLF